VPLEGLAPPLPGEKKAARANGASVMVFSVEGSLYAYRNSCSRCGASLDQGMLTDGAFTCANCRERYDVRLAGRSLDGSNDIHLDPLPLLSESGTLKVAVPAVSRV
jgi:nitrite reductase/ring-hydroxylating ferredoxin subunit